MNSDDFNNGFDAGWKAHKEFLVEFEKLNRGSAFGVCLTAFGITMLLIQSFSWAKSGEADFLGLFIGILLIALGLLFGHKEKQRDIAKREAFAKKWGNKDDR